MSKLPRHIILEDKKEVWFVGSYMLSLGLRNLINTHFIGYKGCLCSQDYFDILETKLSLI